MLVSRYLSTVGHSHRTSKFLTSCDWQIGCYPVAANGGNSCNTL